MTIPVEGGCLCGAVRVSARVKAKEVRPCTCTQCQRQNSAVWLDVPSAHEVRWEGTPAVYRASARATRGFCARCGTTLYWQGEGEGPALSHAILTDRDGWRLLATEYAEDAPDCFRVVASSGKDRA